MQRSLCPTRDLSPLSGAHAYANPTGTHIRRFPTSRLTFLFRSDVLRE